MMIYWIYAAKGNIISVLTWAALAFVLGGTIGVATYVVCVVSILVLCFIIRQVQFRYEEMKKSKNY